jgi:hypothetical protein
MAPDDVPRVPALITAEVPVLAIDAVIGALLCFTIIDPLHLPWWAPVTALALAITTVVVLRRLARGHQQGFWTGLAVMRAMDGRAQLIGLILFSMGAQVARNWLLLDASGLHLGLIGAMAVMIGVGIIGQLPLGPSAGAAGAALIAGAGGMGAALAAGVLLSATGVIGALCFGVWALGDRSWRACPRALPRAADIAAGFSCVGLAAMLVVTQLA